MESRQPYTGNGWAWLEAAQRYALDKIDGNLEVFVERFPAPASERLVYAAIPNEDWTASFWTGMVWLAYELTGDAKYRQAAESQLPSFTRRVIERIAIDTHDLGFLYSLSAVAACKLTGNTEARDTALLAAELLAERYFPEAGIIQAWGDLNDPEQRGRMIIDCLMNLPLLYWASVETGEAKYRELARVHAEQSAQYLIRPDNTSFHTYYMDPVTGAPKYGNTHQGYADDSCWARGQAWGIYGFILSYRYTGDPLFMHASCRLANYFLDHRPRDRIVYWDLIFSDGAEEEKDSSAAAIAVCGLLELAECLPDDHPDKKRYADEAIGMLAVLAESYTTSDTPGSNGLLKHAVYNKPRGWGIDECAIWGDYFYLEALTRLSGAWQLYW